MKREKGFTLIELIFAVGLLAILLAIGAPQYLKFKTQQNAKSAATTLLADLRFLSQLSIKHEKLAYAKIANDHYYELFVDENEDQVFSNDNALKKEDIAKDFGSTTLVYTLSGGTDALIVFGGTGSDGIMGGELNTNYTTIAPSGSGDSQRYPVQVSPPKGAAGGYLDYEVMVRPNGKCDFRQI